MKIAKEIDKVVRFVASSKKLSFKYSDIGHGKGSIIWWVDNAGKIKTFKSTGKEFHHELNKRMDMDARWRGRVEDVTGTTTLLPPLKIYSLDPEDIEVPSSLIRQLEGLGAKRFFMDTAYGGMRRVAEKK